MSKQSVLDISSFRLSLFSAGGRRQVKMDEKFFQGYRKTALKSEEVVVNILLPFTSKVR